MCSGSLHVTKVRVDSDCKHQGRPTTILKEGGIYLPETIPWGFGPRLLEEVSKP